jgi:hypothetical protein
MLSIVVHGSTANCLLDSGTDKQVLSESSVQLAAPITAMQQALA